jgi:hypothetical protein
MQIGQILRIAMAVPQLILKSRVHGTEQKLGVNATQFTQNDIPFSNIKTVKKIIGGVGVAGCDFNFATAGNASEQVINLGAIIPAFARVIDVKTKTSAVFNSKAVASALVSLTSNVATITTGANHGLVSGVTVTLAGFTEPHLNGSFTATVTGVTTFTVPLTHADITEVADTGGTVTATLTLAAETGNSSSGHEFIGSGTIKAADAITYMAADHAMTVAPAAAASSVYVAATPNVFWANLTTGKVEVFVTYIETF